MWRSRSRTVLGYNPFLISAELAMTQQEQQEFTDSLEAALSWMKAVQERLKANDNTQGPRDALEARLRETEVRCCSGSESPGSSLVLRLQKL